MSGGVREEFGAAVREAVIDWNTLGPSARIGEDVSEHLARVLLPVVERVVAEARADALREVEALLPGFEADYGIQSSPVARLRAVLRQAGGGE